jgi:hypothetical protein
VWQLDNSECCIRIETAVQLVKGREGREDKPEMGRNVNTMLDRLVMRTLYSCGNEKQQGELT